MFSVGLEYFFAGAREKPLVAVSRSGSRASLPDRPGARDVAFRFESLDYAATERRFNAYYAEFLPHSKDHARRHRHPGVEFRYVLQGTLCLHVAERDHTLEAGDAMYFDSDAPHAYRRAGARDAARS